MAEGSPISPEINSSTKEKPIKLRSFKEVHSRFVDLKDKLKREGELDFKEITEKNSLKKREKNLIDKAKKAGKFDDLDENLKALRKSAELKMLSEDDISHQAKRFKEGSDRLTDIESGELEGIREYYYLEGLRNIGKDYAYKIIPSKKEKPFSVAEFSNNEEINREIEKIKAELLKGNLSEEEIEKLKDKEFALLKRQGELSRENQQLVQTEEGFEYLRGLKNKFRDDPEAFFQEFEQVLEFLIETQKEKNFDADRLQTRALDNAIQSIPVSGYFTFSGKTYDLAETRRKLSDRLDACRSGHNATYLYQNASQMSDLFRVTEMLKGETERYLTHDRQIASAFRGLAKLLEGPDKKLAASLILEKEAKKPDGSRLQLLDEEGREIPYWAIRLAGILICTQHLAAPVDVSINQGGDFFQNRLFNVSDRARKQWQEVLHRPQNFGLYEALDLRVKGVWEVRLEGKINEMLKSDPEIKKISDQIKIERDPKEVEKLEKDIKRLKAEKSEEIKKEFIQFCERIGITAKDGGQIQPEFNEEKGAFIIARGSFSLSKLKLEEIDISAEFGLSQDATKLVYLDLADAENIRKLIFDPTLFLEKPVPSLLMKIWPAMKHLKGDERSSWFAGVLKETAKLYQEKPNWLIRFVTQEAKKFTTENEARKFIPDAPILNDEAIFSLFESFRPLINENDARKILMEVIGKTPEQMKAWELIKTILELITLAVAETAKASLETEGIKIPKGK